MAQEPPMSAPKASSYSSLYSVPNFQPPSGALGVSPCSSMMSMSATSTDKAQQFGSMINEIERVRSRFENEKSHSDQFTQQMGMLAKQIESLTSQQSTMLGFHIGRIDSMLQELKSSKEALSKDEQRAKLEQEQRERRVRLQREELERKERLERERKEFMEKLRKEEIERRSKEEREQRVERDRFEREQRERREKEKVEREYRENMQGPRQASMPSMNLSDIIPRPSRTVTASKRKLSLDLSAMTTPSSVAPPSSALASLVAASSAGASDDEPAKKRAKTADESAAPDDFQAMFQTFMDQQNQDNAPKDAASDGDEEMVTMAAPTAVEDSSDLAPMDLGNEALPTDIHEQLKNQAMAMLQAQIAAGESMPLGGDGIDLPPIGEEMSPTNQMSMVKPEPPSQPSALPPAASSSSQTPMPASALPVVKPEPTSTAPAVKPEAKSKPKPKKAKKPAKPVTPAVEDTTIADPMSVPLKNKAIHQWMMQDPDRLYTADDICKAGIRYRAHTSNPKEGTHKNGIYVIQSKHSVSQCLRRYKMLFKCEKTGGSQRSGAWRAM